MSPSDPPPVPRLGITLLEAGLAAVLLSVPAGIAGWKLAAPWRARMALRQALQSSSKDEQIRAARQLFFYCRGGMTEGQVLDLYGPVVFHREVRAGPGGESRVLLKRMIGHDDFVGNPNHLVMLFSFKDGRLVKEDSHCMETPY